MSTVGVPTIDAPQPLPKCEHCGQVMVDPKSYTCGQRQFRKNGFQYKYSVPWTGTEPCPDCGVHAYDEKHNAYHHPGCDIEQCPFCGKQLISCECEFDKE